MNIHHNATKKISSTNSYGDCVISTQFYKKEKNSDLWDGILNTSSMIVI